MRLHGLAAAGGTSNAVGAGENPEPCLPSAWEKHGVVLSDEAGPVQNFTCAAEPLDGGRWRLWYSQSRGAHNVGYAEGVPGERMERHLAVLSSGEPPDAPLAIGNLPAGWQPVQGVHLRLNNGRHRLYFWAHGPKVVRYLAAESEDGRRYRVLDPLRPCLYHPNDRAVDGTTAAAAGLTRLAKKVAAREDGEPAADVGLISNDATNVYQLDDGTFEMYSVALVEVPKQDKRYVAHDNAAGWLRVVDRYASEDGLRWTDRRRIVEADAHDPSDMQFYYLAVTRMPEGRMGMLGHYRVEAQTMDLEWCFSADGRRWQRPARRASIARSGEAGLLRDLRSARLGARGGTLALVLHGDQRHAQRAAVARPADASGDARQLRVALALAATRTEPR